MCIHTNLFLEHISHLETANNMSTIQIKYCDIPSYLHAGEFYRSLDRSDPEGIVEIPADCFHPDGETVAELEEFRQLLRVMVFWMLDAIPVGALCYCDKHGVGENGLVDLPGAMEVEVQPLLQTAFSKPGIVPFKDIIKTDRWDLITHAVSKMKKSGRAAAIAANCGNLRLLKYLHEEGFAWSEDTCWAASNKGYLECLQYLHESGCAWDKNVYICAAWNGHLSCIQYAFEQGLEWHSEVCSGAALEGHLNCLEFAYENGCLWDVNVHICAAGSGHLACMKYAHEQGLEWHVDVCKEAALDGHLNCLQFAHENGCPWDEETTKCAAQNGHVRCLRYALEFGCPVDADACGVACMKGHLECLQLLHFFGVPWDETTLFLATVCPDVACLQFLHEQGCVWDEGVSDQVAMQGQSQLLKYALEHGCPHRETIMLSVLFGNNLECLRFLVADQGLYMGEEVFTYALLKGSLCCVQYLIDQGCPYLDVEFGAYADDWEEYDQIFRNNNSEFILCVQYAVERGWPLCENFINYIVTRDEPCMQWLISEGHCYALNQEYREVCFTLLQGNTCSFLNMSKICLISPHLQERDGDDDDYYDALLQDLERRLQNLGGSELG